MIPLLLKITRLTDKLSTSHMITALMCQTTVGQSPQAKKMQTLVWTCSLASVSENGNVVKDPDTGRNFIGLLKHK